VSLWSFVIEFVGSKGRDSWNIGSTFKHELKSDLKEQFRLNRIGRARENLRDNFAAAPRPSSVNAVVGISTAIRSHNKTLSILSNGSDRVISNGSDRVIR
jgi:hypothetical protein